MCQVVEKLVDFQILWDHKVVADIEEVIGEGCPFNVVFKGPVYRTGKKTETGLNWAD